MNKGALIFLVVILFASVSSIWLSVADQLNAIEPQPPIPLFPDTVVEVESSHKDLLIEKAINDPDVEEYLESGYEIYKVLEYHDVVNDCFIYRVLILTQMQRLPWVLGISLGVQVDFAKEGALSIQYYLTLANLTDSQKDQVMSIASNYVVENYGADFSIQANASVASWEETAGGNFSFYAYSSASFRVPSDWSKSGFVQKVYVDLERNEVVKVQSFPSKSFPPDSLP